MSLYGAEIFWLQTAPRKPAEPLRGDARGDVVIIGGGFTGLWTAYHLKHANPGIDVVLLEAFEIGSGASGRNGGFAMTLLDMSLALLAKNHGDDGARAAHNAVAQSVDEIGAATAEHGIDCDYHKGGLLVVATNEAQQARLDRDLETAERLGLHGYTSLTGAETRARLDSPTYRGGYHEEACAIVHPARLCRGLDEVIRAKGVRVFEHTAVESVTRDGDHVRVRCAGGSVQAQQVVFATNAWSSALTRNDPPVLARMSPVAGRWADGSPTSMLDLQALVPS